MMGGLLCASMLLPWVSASGISPSAPTIRRREMTPAQTLCFTEVHRFLAGLFEGDLHAKRVLSLANATLGVLETASLPWFKKCHFQVTPERDCRKIGSRNVLGR